MYLAVSRMRSWTAVTAIAVLLASFFLLSNGSARAEYIGTHDGIIPGGSSVECDVLGGYENAVKWDEEGLSLVIDGNPNPGITLDPLIEGNEIVAITWSINSSFTGVVGVKAGRGYNLYSYSGAVGDSDLIPYQDRGLSHITFCWNGDITPEEVEPTPVVPTPEPSPTPEPDPLFIVSGSVFEDLDYSESSTAGDADLGGLTVELLDENNNVIATTQTAADGSYAFEDVAPGIYTIQVLDPAGQYLTTGNDGQTIDVVDSDVVAEEIGFAPFITISGDVVLDPQSCDLPAVSGFGTVLVTLGIESTLTDGSGDYSFAGLEHFDGPFSVTVNNPDISSYYLAPGSGDETTAVGSPYSTMMSVSTVQYNEYISVSGLVSIQVNGGLVIAYSGATVSLTGTDDAGNLVALSAVITDNGMFEFSGMRLGDYQLSYSYAGVEFGSEQVSADCSATVDGATYQLDTNSVVSCLDSATCVGEGRTIGFWKAQLSGRKGKGNNLTSEMPSLLGQVESIALDAPYKFSDISVEGSVDAAGVAEALAIMDDKNNKDAGVKLLKQLLGSELNSVYGNVGGLEDNLLEGALFNWGEALLNDGSASNAELLYAKDIFDGLNNMGH
ncbi:MAG: hypothetical protein HQ478_02180 [Chloroflexi bacterium]|nr:hypothetical protein [Chloroflexota bacterium]